MAEESQAHNLEQLLEAIAEAGHGREDVSVAEIHEMIGVRSFGPLLLAVGLIGLTPIGGIPGLPTVVAIIIVLISGQLLVGRTFWLPGFIRRRSVQRDRLHKAIGVVRPVARAIDKLLRPRLVRLTAPPVTQVIAAICILIALSMPPLELVPFAGAAPMGAVALFGLGLTARDGFVVVLALALSAASVYIVATSLG